LGFAIDLDFVFSAVSAIPAVKNLPPLFRFAKQNVGARKKSKTKPISRPKVGNPKSEYLNPKQVERPKFEKTNPILKWAKMT
jgi:hypothetical protein